MPTRKKEDEIIGYVARQRLEELGYLAREAGVLTDLPCDHIARLTEHLQWGRRGPLEQDPDNKQLIPYIVLWRRREEGGKEIFVMRRKRAQREARLHDRLSIGVGGHINPDEEASPLDDSKKEVIAANAWRELEEEVFLHGERRWRELSWQPVGLLNDDRDEVGQVHLGLVFTMEIPRDHDVTVRETDKLEGFWCKQEEIDVARLETWSKLSLAHVPEVETNS